MQERVLLAEGREAEVFALPDGSVLKLMRADSDGPRVEREASVLCALADAHLPAPTVVDTVTIDGRPGLVMERIRGDDLLDLLGRRPLAVFSAGKSMGTAHAAMHDCLAPDTLPDLIDDLRRQIEAARPLPEDLRAASLAILDDMPRGDTLCHGDLHLGNMIGSWSDVVIIDWANATRGDPTADVARTALLHRIGDLPPGAPALIRALAPVGRQMLVARYLASYRKRRTIDARLLERWKIVRAAARLDEGVVEEEPKLLAYVHDHLTT